MKKSTPSVLFYPADYLVGCIGMTYEEKGRYMDLLCYQQQKGHLDIDRIMPDCPDSVKEKFIQDENGLYYNRRMEEEMEKRYRYCESRRKNLKADDDYSHMDKHMDSHMGEHMDNHMEQHMDSHMYSHMDNDNDNNISFNNSFKGKGNESIKPKRTKNINNKLNIYKGPAKEFDELWQLYPRKQGKQRAVEAYKRARKNGVTFDEVKNGITAYVEYISREKIDSQFIKQGSTFFSQQAWQDDWTPKRITTHDITAMLEERDRQQARKEIGDSP